LGSTTLKQEVTFLNAKMIPVETIPGIGRGEIKEIGGLVGGSEYKYDTL
jgi:hypothetical protein